MASDHALQQQAPAAAVAAAGAGGFGWVSVVRLGLVQMALGGIVVLTTSTLNRVMVVELALPAIVPGALVTLHHAMQLLRPRMGFGSDLGARRTPWIVGGMAALALGGLAAAGATALMSEQLALGLALGTVAFAAIGAGVSATGTSLLVLMAKRVPPQRKAAAATVVWMMMIAGLGLTASLAGKLLDPYSPQRLLAVAGAVSALAMLLTLLAIWRVEGEDRLGEAGPPGAAEEPEVPFGAALRQVWGEGDARRFTVFVFVSMLAYSAQDLILEPFAGSVFGFTPGRSTSLSGVQHGGAFAGMLVVGVATTALKGTRGASLQGWVIGGCLASAAMMAGLVVAGLSGAPWPLEANVFLMGLANGAFSIAAIGSMMSLASQGRKAREGVRMGLWGAAQAIAFAVGGFLGTVLVDGAKLVLGASGRPYAFVFALEGAAFLVSAWLALGVRFPGAETAPAAAQPVEG